MNPDAVMDFLAFVPERHRVWEKRQAGLPPPWTDDPVLASRKFTNVFRVLDYGSQFLLNELLDPELDPRDQLMRCFLYRHTGRWEAWQFFELMEGRYPLAEDLDRVLERLTEYRGTTTTTTMRKSHKETPYKIKATQTAYQRPVFTGAYLVFPQSDAPGTDKLESIVDLTYRLFDPSSPTDVVPDFLAAPTQAQRFAVLRRNKGVADFMSMQVLTDWGYTTEDREDEFVVPGPGARKGAEELAPGSKPEATLAWALEAVRGLDDCPQLSNGRRPSLMDVQNCLCEFSKYVRGPTAKPYSPAHPGPQPDPTIPWS